MKSVSLLVTAAILISLTGCAGTATKLGNETDRLISKSVYATDDSIAAKRYDLAKYYSGQSVRLVAPPDAKERIKVTAVTKKGSTSKPAVKTKKSKNTSTVFSEPTVTIDVPPDTFDEVPVVVLPAEDKGAIVIIQDSPEYKALEQENKQFKAENDKIKADKATLKGNVDRLLAKKEAFQKEEALKEQTTHWYSHIFSFFGWFFGLSGLFTVIIIVGLIVLCVVNPVLGGLVIGVIGKVFKAAGLIFQGIFWVISSALTAVLALFNKKSSVSGPPNPIPPPPPAPDPPPKP